MDAHAVAGEVWTDAGGDAEALDSLMLSGGDPILPSIFRVGTVALASIGGASLAVAETARMRTGRRPEVSVGAREAAVAFRSERYLQIGGNPAPDAWNPISGYYRCGDDRWIQLHCNFPHHRDGVLAYFGVENEREQVKAAIAERTAADVEDGLVAQGMCVTMMRTRDEWRTGPGAALAGTPLVRIERVGDADPRPLPVASDTDTDTGTGTGTGTNDRPLSGMRVLDLTRVLAGPVCGRFLASHGADVMRIGSSRLPTLGPHLLDTNLGKRWADIDLTKADDAAALRALEGDSDVFVQGYRPGSIANHGFGVEQVAERNPGIVYVSICAFGYEGPWAQRRGFDSLTQVASGIAAEGGLASATDRPGPLPCQALDHGTGYLAAMGGLLARHRQAEEGGSWHVRVSLARTGWWLDDLGRVDDGLDCPDPTAEDVDDLLIDSVSAQGPIRHAPPPGRLDGEPGIWRLPSSDTPNSRPVW